MRCKRAAKFGVSPTIACSWDRVAVAFSCSLRPLTKAKAVTPRSLARRISRVGAPITESYAHTLVEGGVWSDKGVWYKTQKEHCLGWLSEYDGPGAYGRKTRSGRSAEFVYNHINCPPMLLWLAEAAGVSKRDVLAAKRIALSARRNRGTHCAVIRRAIPWSIIEERLCANGSG